MRHALLIAMFSLSALVAVWPAPAQADEAQDRAEALFRRGKSLFDERRFPEACPLFAESFRLEPLTGSLLALASCHEAEEKLATAWSEYTEVVVRSVREGRADRAEATNERVKWLAPRLARLTVVPPVGAAKPQLSIRVDGEELAALANLPLDRGTHTLRASSPGYAPFERTFLVADGETVTIAVPELSARTAPTTPASHSPMTPLGIAIGGLGLVTLGVASGFGIHAIAKNDQSFQGGNCSVEDVCNPVGAEARRSARGAGNASTALFVVGGVVTAVGVTLVIFGKAADARSVTVAPIVSQGGPGILLHGKF